MPAFLPILVTASHVVLAADTVPKFNVEASCRATAGASTAPNVGASDCRRDEIDAQTKLQQDWTRYSTAQRSQCVRLSSLGSPPSYVELLTCLEMAKQAQELPEDSKKGTGER